MGVSRNKADELRELGNDLLNSPREKINNVAALLQVIQPKEKEVSVG